MVKENRHFPVNPHKSGPKTVTVKSAPKQPGYKRTTPRHVK